MISVLESLAESPSTGKGDGCYLSSTGRSFGTCRLTVAADQMCVPITGQLADPRRDVGIGIRVLEARRSSETRGSRLAVPSFGRLRPVVSSRADGSNRRGTFHRSLYFWPDCFGPWLLSPNSTGPCSWNSFFHLYSVCFETPTRGAKSPAGSPLRRHVSRSSRRCWPVKLFLADAGSGLDSARGRRRLPNFRRLTPSGDSHCAVSHTMIPRRPVPIAPDSEHPRLPTEPDTSQANRPYPRRPAHRPGYCRLKQLWPAWHYPLRENRLRLQAQPCHTSNHHKNYRLTGHSHCKQSRHC